ncbi:MAG: Fe-S cluster assembly protein SufD [Methylococcales bacterium]|nr:Fe-S cluster assembly protein SufD [Methylococcales bacterium]
MMTTSVSRYTAEYQTLAPTLPGHDLPWLQQLRQQALAEFSVQGFPSPRAEEWRYTNVSAIEKKLFAPVAKLTGGAIDREWLTSQQLADVWSVVLVDGHFSAELSVLAGLPDSVVVLGMADALAKQPDCLEAYLNKGVNNQEHGFIAFNTAWFSDGVLLHIPAKLALEKPVQILHVATHAEALISTRTVLIADDHAQASVIETFVGFDNAYLTAAVTEVFVGENAGITLTKVQCESAKAYHFGGTYVKQARDARFTHHNFAFGGLLARSDIHTDLGLASECELFGLYLGVNRQHIDNHTRINHLKPHAVSRELYKGVLDDRARGVFQGRVIVALDAQHTDSQMNNRNLLLSSDAEADTKPQLEIYADDVKCGHGVTVGQLDEKSIFYLQSRCIDEETARNMLTFAFANEMVDKIKIKSLHDLVLEQVLLRFPQEGVEKNWL